MDINFINNTDFDISEYKKSILKVFSNIDKEYTFSIVFVTNYEIQRLNKEYRNKDSVTDVLSFALIDNLINYNIENEIGDIFISIEKAIEQSIEYNHSVIREICFLSVHGFLHLLGYDHQNSNDEKIMIEKQNEILNKAGIYRD